MQTDYDTSYESQNLLLFDQPPSPPAMSFPTSNPDHSWNETPLTNFPHGMRPQGQAMFQEPPLPPTQTRRLRTMAGTYGLTSTPLTIHSPFASRTNAPTLRTPGPRYRLSSSSRPFAIPATPVHYGSAPPFMNPPSHHQPPIPSEPNLPTTQHLSFSTPPVPFELVPPPTLPPIQTRTATPIPPITEETNQSLRETMTTPSTHMEGTTSGPNSALLTESFSDPIAPRPGSSDGSTSSSEATSTPRMSESQWATTSPSPASPCFHNTEETLPWRPEYSPTETAQNTPPPPEIRYQMLAPEPRPSSASWLTTYSHWPLQRETAQTWMAPPEVFNDFNYDQETFGNYTPELSRDYRGYTPAPTISFYNAPFPLPNSPNWEYQPPTNYPTHPRRLQGYKPPQYGTRPFAGQDPPNPDNNEQAGGSNDPPQPTIEERTKKA
ncbi:uncharacterized protein ARMOST_07718 [Armillaria ostoyae]|uniref:Uncharacterized protein n=1 Tax=Armillaria ostoyae TaxID=47428 RepID=A0A284R6M7_ARMOS|nr:uncharacterized protein ARMOST_07718 [Armillaria ostoyae]